MAIRERKKICVFLVLLVFVAGLSASFAQPPVIVHHRKAMEFSKAMIEHGEKAVELSNKAADAILPDGMHANSKAMMEQANIMIDRAEQFIRHMQNAIDERPIPRDLREHGSQAVSQAKDAIHHQKEAIKRADAAIKARFNMMEAKHYAKQSREHAEDALKKARAANDHAAFFEPAPRPRPPIRRY